MWRGIITGICLAVFAVGVASGQAQRSPATLDDLLMELRGLRADIGQGTRISTQAELLMGRLQLQEQRISLVSGQLFDTRQRLANVEKGITPMQMELNHAEEISRTNPATAEGAGRHLEHLRAQLAQAEAERDQLRRLEADLTTSLAIEHNRWTDFDSRLDELEQALAR